MKAFRVHDLAIDPAVAEIDAPRAGPEEVQVRVAACGINFADLLLARGKYQERPALPFTLGMEFAGTVAEVGAGVDALRVGDRVAAYSGSGGLAEFAVCPANRCVPLPDAMPFEEAAAFVIAYGTSHVALAHRARLKPGETLLVLGAAGGVGLTAVEIGKRMGATVIAAARGASRLEVTREAGADHLIDTGNDDLRERVKAAGGADVVYDPVGGALFDAAMRAVKPEARVIVIGFASGEIPQIRANHLLVKNTSVLGVYWGGYMTFRPEVISDSLTTLFGWYADGGLRPHVSHILPLEQAGAAMELLRSRNATGKVVVTIGSDQR